MHHLADHAAGIRTLAPSHAPRSPGQRVGDLERSRAEDLLGQAWALGYLRREELDARLDRVVGSATVADVDAVLADLPMHELRRRDPRARAARARRMRIGLQVHAAAVAGASLLMVAIWLVVALTAGAWFPWPVFPVLGCALGVAGHAAAVRGAARW
ncbi:DUF1707 SHOCT-like domain-containing protein [Solicola sp. PLA-1-18]|uniref:DUF1707 SHOCT-like domain-containing protein n=1 Tax=Solicola sp. PLA-1-18 TaxID=3380532 RepID=UPI003B800826